MQWRAFLNCIKKPPIFHSCNSLPFNEVYFFFHILQKDRKHWTKFFFQVSKKSHFLWERSKALFVAQTHHVGEDKRERYAYPIPIEQRPSDGWTMSHTPAHCHPSSSQASVAPPIRHPGRHASFSIVHDQHKFSSSENWNVDPHLNCSELLKIELWAWGDYCQPI